MLFDYMYFQFLHTHSLLCICPLGNITFWHVSERLIAVKRQLSMFVSYIIVKISSFSTRWWWISFCTRPTRLARSLNNSSRKKDMSPYSHRLSWFRASQFLLFLLNIVSLARNNKYKFYSVWLDPIGVRIPNHRPHSRRHANYYTTDAVHF